VLNILEKSIFGLESEGFLHLPIWFGFGIGFII
jgi:hypothetical protein